MEAGNAIACGVRKALPESEVIVVPVPTEAKERQRRSAGHFPEKF